MYFCVVLCIVCFVTYSVLFVCICVLNYCHRVGYQIAVKYISYHIKHLLGDVSNLSRISFSTCPLRTLPCLQKKLLRETICA